jgi:hypothetical protein
VLGRLDVDADLRHAQEIVRAVRASLELPESVLPGKRWHQSL